MNKKNIMISLICNYCDTSLQKTLAYVERRQKAGKAVFFCSRECTDKHHAERMQGEGNPNYNGKWNAPCASTWSEEKRRQASEKSSATKKASGVHRGENNPRWAGGKQEHDCIICGTTSDFSPYVHRLILSGDRQPTCSTECSSALARRNLPLVNTSIEIAVANELTRRGIVYDDQYNLGDKFRLDFFLPEYGIVIECDGDYWHRLPQVVARDKRKNSYIKACGFSLYRFWESEINADVEACIDVVLAEINDKEAVS